MSSLRYEPAVHIIFFALYSLASDLTDIKSVFCFMDKIRSYVFMVAQYFFDSSMND